MTGRGRRAVLPPADHRTEPSLAVGGLVVTVTNNAGHGRTFSFAELPVAEPMQRSLAALFALRSSGWTSHVTAKSYWVAVHAFARFLSQLEEPPDDLGDLTTAQLKRWRAQHIGTNSGRSLLRHVRPLLKLDSRLTRGPLAEELARRVPASRPVKKSYAEEDRERVLRAAQQQFRSALLRIRENTQLLERWRTGDLVGGSREWRIGQVLDHLTHTGDVPRAVMPSGEFVKDHRLLGGTNPEAPRFEGRIVPRTFAKKVSTFPRPRRRRPLRQPRRVPDLRLQARQRPM
ncbi:hypothetical protein ACWC5C_20695 [Streptomyces sp. NPDC001700]